VLDLKRQAQAGSSISMSMKWLNQAMNHASQRSVLKLVEKQLAQGIHKLDANPDLIGIKGYVYELTTGTVRPALGQDLVFKTVGTSYDADATCPEWEQFLHTVMQDDEEMIGFLQRLVGYCLTSSVSEQLIFFFYGSGANGKSTFLDLLKALLGDYSVKIVSDAIMRSKSGERSNTVLASLAHLLGARLAITDEIGDNAVFDTQSLKSISGDDETVARLLYGNPITFKSTAKLVMFGNDKPYGNINDEGFWRRLRFIHFGYVIPPEHRDPHLLSKLKVELPGILNWALEGLVEWRQHGLQVPQKVLDDSVEYRNQLDTVTEYFDDNVVFAVGATVTSKQLYEAYTEWCDENLLPKESKTTFSRKAAQYFKAIEAVQPYKSSKSRGYKGVRLK
jgi:putative DNA primase/helicase